MLLDGPMLRRGAILALLASLIRTGVVGGLFALTALWVANPPVDTPLAAIDAAIGFDHRRFLASLAARPWVPPAGKLISRQRSADLPRRPRRRRRRRPLRSGHVAPVVAVDR